MKGESRMKKKNSDQKKKAAKRYVDTQLRIMRKYGSSPRLSRQDYRVLVNKIARETTA